MSVLEKLEKTNQTRGDDRIGLSGIWHLVRRHIVLVLVITAACVAATFAVVSEMEPHYKSRSTVVMALQDTRVRATDVQLESFELSRVVIETELDVLKSREFAAEVTTVLSLFDDPGFAGVVDPDQPEPEVARRERVIDKMLSSYSVSRHGESLAIEITATSVDPALAADIANTVAEIYILKSMLKRREGITQSIEFLRTRVDELGEELSQSELELAADIRENNLDDQNLPIRLRADVERLTSIYEVVRDDPASVEEAPLIAKELEEAQAALHARTRAELALMRKERSLELLRARYQTSIEKLNELETQLQFVGQGARQVSVARVPVDPYWPNPRLAVAASAAAGFTLAFIIAYLTENMNTRVWSENQILRVTGLVNYGFLPRIKKRGLFPRRHEPLWFLENNPNSSFAEALHSFLTLWFNVGSAGKVMMVTSGLPNEGKSTVAVSLAAAAARDGMKVLVLDFDSHRRGAMKLFGVEQTALSVEEVLAGDGASEPVSVEGEAMEGITLLSLKTRSKSPLPALKTALAELKEGLLGYYDLILVDTPPVLIVDDACRLGPLIDRTLLVVRWGNTTEAVLRDATEKLSMNGIEVSATLVNDVDTRKHRRYGYGGYAHYYSYGTSDYS
ncbi:AAA family ATPase [Ruegeria sp. HKCCD8929]|uniref:GumC family protein n=1 Tax=Ruegeria sp. HKCCD8929 TaxID=2683006 RepID=UPI001487D85D|nr:P-loop NTPase [Ruegeria sp. HKCCD8929]